MIVVAGCGNRPTRRGSCSYPGLPLRQLAVKGILRALHPPHRPLERASNSNAVGHKITDQHLLTRKNICSIVMVSGTSAERDAPTRLASLRLLSESSAPPSTRVGRTGSGRCMDRAVPPTSHPPGPRPSPLAPFAASPEKEGSRFETLHNHPIETGRSRTQTTHPVVGQGVSARSSSGVSGDLGTPPGSSPRELTSEPPIAVRSAGRPCNLYQSSQQVTPRTETALPLRKCAGSTCEQLHQCLQPRQHFASRNRRPVQAETLHSPIDPLLSDSGPYPNSTHLPGRPSGRRRRCRVWPAR